MIFKSTKNIKVIAICFFSLFSILPVVSLVFHNRPASKLYSLGFQNDFVILKNYEKTKKYEGGLLTIDSYRELNKTYGNIFAYFELPVNSDGSIVPLKGAGRVFLKAPIILMSGPHLFPAIWKFIGLNVCLGLCLVLFSKFSYREKTILFFSLLTFIPFLVFDFEFGSLFACVSMLYLFLIKNNNSYLLFYFIFGLYCSITRADFFLFFSACNLYISLYAILQKKYLHILYVFFVSITFLILYLFINKEYYGGYMTTGYEVQRDVTQLTLGVGSSANFLDIILKPFSFIFPMGINLKESFSNFSYVIGNGLGLALLLLFFDSFFGTRRPFLFKKKKSFQYFIIVFVSYGIILYASHPYFYRPVDSPLFSSYTRYLGVFILLLWLSLYRGFFVLPKIVKILYCCFLLFHVVSGIHILGKVNNDLDSDAYITSLEKMIPKDAVVLPMRPVRFILSDYRILQPSGADTEEYIVFTTFGRTSRRTSFFLDKIGKYVQSTKVSVYIVGDGQAYAKTVNFFQNKNLIVEKHPLFSIIKDNGSGEYSFDTEAIVE